MPLDLSLNRDVTGERMLIKISLLNLRHGYLWSSNSILIKEFQRLKDEEQKQLGWDIKRNLTKINYRIHTDAIKKNLIPNALTPQQISHVYASEADVLNITLFGMTAKMWRDANPDKTGNIRDDADVSQLVCLANLETLNALFIQDGLSQQERLAKLNAIAIEQMRILTERAVKNLLAKGVEDDE